MLRTTALNEREAKTQMCLSDKKHRAGLSVGAMALGFTLNCLQIRRQSMLECS